MVSRPCLWCDWSPLALSPLQSPSLVSVRVTRSWESQAGDAGTRGHGDTGHGLSSQIWPQSLHINWPKHTEAKSEEESIYVCYLKFKRTPMMITFKISKGVLIKLVPCSLRRSTYLPLLSSLQAFDRLN